MSTGTTTSNQEPPAHSAPPRVGEIDVWRGLAIVLVVVGHAIQFTVADFDANLVFRAIYAFHMPLFFFISGLVGARALDRPLAQQLKSRTLGLVVPFLSWYLVVQIGSRMLAGGDAVYDRFIALFSHVDTGLWFLWVLFLVTMAAAVLIRIPRIPRTVTLLAACLIMPFIQPTVLGLGLFKWYFPFFVIGVILAPGVAAESWKSLKKWWVPTLLAVAYGVLVFGWTRPGRVPLALAWDARGLPLSQLVDYSYRYITSGIGILASLSAIMFIPLGSRAARSLSFLGRRTLEIYVSHALFLIPFAGAGLVWSPVAALTAGVGALLLAGALKRVSLLRTLLYGGRR